MNAGDLRIKIFADGADRDEMLEMYRNPLVKGFTTNPTLMRKAGVANFESFARGILESITDKPISFEVFSDRFDEMERQARAIAGWGGNVYVKIPVTDTRGNSSVSLIRKLAATGIKLNVTAVMTVAQVEQASSALAEGPSSYVSVFAGRIADSGRDPLPIMRESLTVVADRQGQELIWASAREVLNVVQADAIGVHVVTVTYDMLSKLPLLGKDLDEFSLDTVKMFYDDARSAGFSL